MCRAVLETSDSTIPSGAEESKSREATWDSRISLSPLGSAQLELLTVTFKRKNYLANRIYSLRSGSLNGQAAMQCEVLWFVIPFS